MLISKAYAAATAATGAPPALPDAGEAFIWNMGLVFTLVVLFYVLLIMPQQKRFKEHSTMLSGLKKGDRVVTGGGLIGVLEEISAESDEVVVDLGNGVKVKALRSSLQGDAVLRKPANANSQKKADSKK